MAVLTDLRLELSRYPHRSYGRGEYETGLQTVLVHAVNTAHISLSWKVPRREHDLLLQPQSNVVTTKGAIELLTLLVVDRSDFNRHLKTGDSGQRKCACESPLQKLTLLGMMSTVSPFLTRPATS